MYVFLMSNSNYINVKSKSKMELEKNYEFDHNNLYALINNTNDLIWSVDRNYNLIASNNAFDDLVRQMTGISVAKGDYLFAKGLNDEEISRHKKAYDRTFLGEHFKVTEYTDIPVRLWAEVSYYPIYQGKEIVGAACYSHNITDLKIAEEKIELNERLLSAKRKRFSDLFLQAPSSICILRGEDLVYEMANPLYLKITGKKDIIGKKAVEVFPEVAAQGFLALVESVYKTGVSFSANEVLIKLDLNGTGELQDHYMDFVYEAYRNDEGEIDGVFFFANLVTEQVLARRKVEQNETYLRALLENGGDIISLVDRQGKITYASPALEKVLGYTSIEIIGQSAFSIVHPTRQADSKDYFSHLLQNPGVPYLRENCYVHKDGHSIWVEGTLINLLEDENVHAIVANLRDITERKLAEEKIINASRLYAFISGIDQTIVHAKDEHTLFKEVCRIAIEVGKFKMAWIGLINLEDKTISLIESHGMIPENVKAFTKVFYDENGPQDRAIKNGNYYVCNDISNDLGTERWKPYASKNELCSCMVILIRKSGIVIGTLNLYSSQLNFFDAQEIMLLEEVARDISFALDVFEKEKKRNEAEKDLLHTRLRLKQAQTTAHVGSWELEISTGKSIWSEETCRIYGIAFEDYVQSFQSWLSFIHPDDMERVIKVTSEAQETLTPLAFHHRIIRKDESIRHIFSEGNFELDSLGKPVSLFGIAHDITEAKKAEEALEQSEANLRQIMDLIPQFIFIKNYTGKYIYANKSFAALYGYSPQEVIGKFVNEIIPKQNDLQYYLLEDMEVISSGKIKIIPEHVITDNNGNTHLMNTIKVPFTVAGTNEKAVLGVGIEITEQKKAEVERTKIITELVQRNNELEQFSSMISHNLRAPVANILGIVDIMQTIGIELGEEKKITDYLAIASKNLDTVIKDINNILDLKHNVHENRERVEFDSVLHEVKIGLACMMKDKTIKIISDFFGAKEMITVKSYLHSIFHNLISNSIKYRQAGIQTIIEVSSAKIENKVQLKFKDNGLGIDLQKKGEEVFGLYKRFHYHVEGKGMGLFIVKTQVHALGGKISLKSEVNNGSEFTIEFDIDE